MTHLTIPELIKNHRAAALQDEALFDNNGALLPEFDADANKASLRAVDRALRALVCAPCRTLNEVKLKCHYLMCDPRGAKYTVLEEIYSADDCSIGERDSLLNTLIRSFTREVAA